MAEGYSFPLKLWEETQDFKQKKKEAEDRFKELHAKAYPLPIGGFSTDVEFTANGIPVVYRNCAPPLGKKPYYPEDALELAKEYGEIGSFTAEEIEDYIKGEGVLVDMAMEGLGFRRHKKDETKWARMTARERRDFQYGQLTPMMADRNYRLYGSPVVASDRYERERLMDLRVGENVPTEHGTTYSLETGSSGMIYMRMDFNPFAYNNVLMSRVANQRQQKAHINQDQEKFVIEACNVKIDTKSVYEPDGVYLRGLVGNNLVHEAVWPVSVPGRELFDFAVDFRDQAISQSASLT